MALSLICDRIYVGSYLALSSPEGLKSKGITHILSVVDGEIEAEKVAGFKHLHLKLQDVDDTNICQYFTETNAFIQEAVTVGGVLIHCMAGVSRSVTVCCAYLMKLNKWTVEQSLELIRSKRPIANPNESFLKQLEIYYKSGYEINADHAEYRRWVLEQAAEHIAYGAPLSANQFTMMDVTANPKSGIRCRKCGRMLVQSDAFILHTPSSTTAATRSMQSTSSLSPACTQYFVEPMMWMKPELERGEIAGKLSCYNCDSKLGSYRWSGGKCSCGVWVTPAFQIQRSRVDEVKYVTQTTNHL